jgi:hypothetical protein
MAVAYNQSYALATAITKSNTVNFDASVSTTGGNVKPCDAIYIGGAGIVIGVLQNGGTISLTCVAGALIPLRLIRVNSTTTTATLMVALYGSS